MPGIPSKQQLCEGSAVIIPILEMRKQAPRGEVTYLKPHAKDVNPVAPVLMVNFLRSFHVEKGFSHANCLGS